MSPFQGRYRLSTNLDFSKQIPYRLRHCYMGRCANIRRRSEAKHCSSLCSQSEGDEYCGGPARAGKPNKSTAPGHHTSYPTSYLSGRVFKIQKNLCAVLSQTTSGKACAHDKRTKREKERPERAASPQPRATPWVSVYKRLRPVKAKVWANGWLLLLPLQGVGNGDMVPRALPWATNLLGFQPAQGRRQGFFRNNI